MIVRAGLCYTRFMAFTSTDYAVCIAAIMAVEAGGRWDAITATDTLSLGAGQWTQGRAYDLLAQFPSGTDFGATVNGWMAQGRDSWTYDSRKYQYIPASEDHYLMEALDSADGRRIQAQQFKTDIENEYLPVCRQAGCDPDAHPQAACLLINCLHQYGTGGRRPYRLVQMASPGLSLDDMLYSLKYWGIYDEYPNRYQMAYEYIRDRVTNGVVVDGQGNQNTAQPGTHQQSVGYSDNKDSQSLSNKVKRVIQSGSRLRVVMEDGSEAWAYPTSVGYWTCSPSQADAASGTTPVPSPTPTPTPGGAMTDMINLLLRDCANKPYGYAQASGRLTPETSGISDCSGYVWYLYDKYFGIDIGTGGTSDIYYNNVGVVVARVSTAAEIRAANPRAGDLIVYPGHIEMFTGNGTMSASMRGPADGAPGPNGPSPAEDIFAGRNCIIKRYV